MKKRFWLVSALFGLSMAIYAQRTSIAPIVPLTGDTVNRVSPMNQSEDKSSFTFTESQLDEDDDAVQSTTSIVSSNDDPFLSNVGYLFSPMRFKVRAYDSKYNDMFANGLMLNDAETGRFSFGMIGGLNDAVRNQEGAAFGEQNIFGYSPIGGANNINMRASQYAAGSKLSLSGCNRNYVARAMFTRSTGLMSNGWAFTISASYRWAKEGVIEGTFYNSLGYFLSAQKIINDRHSLSFATWGSPTQRAQQGAATEESYWLADSHYYNPYWGYQNGEKRNSRVVTSYEPTALLTWDWEMDKERKLTTSAAFKYSLYGSTALGWNGNAADPRPDYYKKLPSSIYNVWDLSTPPTEDEYLQWLQCYDHWTASKKNRQLNWDEMYFANAQSNRGGGDALYYVEERHNDQMAFNLSSIYHRTLKSGTKYTAGIYLNHTKGMHYKTMNDLLGARNYVDVDKFAARDNGLNSPTIQNDLDRPDRLIDEGDKFGYDYDIFVDKARLFATLFHQSGDFQFYAGANLDGTTMERYGNMRNGRAPGKSKGSSGHANFLGGGGKAGVTWKANAQNVFNITAGYSENAPLAYNSFTAPRIKNDFVKDLRTEGILNGELSYQIKSGRWWGKLTGYYTKFMNQVELSQFYNDQESRFTYLTMNGIEKRHYGVEAAFTFNATSALSFTAIGTLNQAEYSNNPDGTLTYESESESTASTVYMEGVKVGSTPLTALSIGADYNINGWFFGVNLNYYDRVYVGASTYRRLGNVMTEYPFSGAYDEQGQPIYDVTPQTLAQYGGILLDKDGKIDKVYTPEQEKFDGGFMLDASIGRYIRMKRGRSLSINLSVNNISNNTNLRTGGYEQNRDDRYTDGSERTYLFSKNSKYYYANAFNAFLNIGYRF